MGARQWNRSWGSASSRLAIALRIGYTIPVTEPPTRSRVAGAIVWCAACGDCYTLHPRQRTCPTCEQDETAGSLREVLLGGARSLTGLRRFVALPRLFLARELRRCVSCEATVFARPCDPCTRCPSRETVPTDLALAVRGEAATVGYYQLRRLAVVAHWVVLTPVLLWFLWGFLVACWYYPIPRVVVSTLVDGLVAAVGVVLLTSLVRLALWSAKPALSPSDAQRPEILAAATHKLVRPFLDRYQVRSQGKTQAPRAELDLLRQALATEGASVPEARIRHLLVSSGLSADLDDFRRRLAPEGLEEADSRGLIRLYADHFGPQEDRQWLPFLQEECATREGPVQDVTGGLDAAREAQRVANFKRALEQQAQQGTLAVTMTMVDAMAPYDFERLIAMLYETEGYRAVHAGRTGDQGADVLLIRGGQRTAIQAKHYQASVGNSAVQEVIAARVFHKCDHAIVVTNSTFTRSAVELAESARVELVDRQLLERLVRRFNTLPKDIERLRTLFPVAQAAPVAAPQQSPLPS